VLRAYLEQMVHACAYFVLNFSCCCTQSLLFNFWLLPRQLQLASTASTSFRAKAQFAAGREVSAAGTDLSTLCMHAKAGYHSRLHQPQASLNAVNLVCIIECSAFSWQAWSMHCSAVLAWHCMPWHGIIGALSEP
jgi:hypothetical protein